MQTELARRRATGRITLRRPDRAAVCDRERFRLGDDSKRTTNNACSVAKYIKLVGYMTKSTFASNAQAIAIEIACVITVPSEDDCNWVARTGSESIFAAVKRILAQVID